jgi:hypothetical protein
VLCQTLRCQTLPIQTDRQTDRQKTDRQTDRGSPATIVFEHTSILHRYTDTKTHRPTETHGDTQVVGTCAEMLLCAVWAVEHRPRPAKRGRRLYVRTLRVRSVREQRAVAGESGVVNPMQGRECYV